MRGLTPIERLLLTDDNYVARTREESIAFKALVARQLLAYQGCPIHGTVDGCGYARITGLGQVALRLDTAARGVTV